jgi:hyperosmotically inducible protein
MNYRIKLTKLLVVGLFGFIALTGCKPSDSTIAENVKSKVSALAQGVTVDVKDGVVTLGGQVADDATKAAVESSLQGVKGVKSVVNDITVPPPPAPTPAVTINPDEVLRKTVDSVLAAKGFKGITATVNNGEVKLSGEVKKADLPKVLQAAHEAKPKKVTHDLKIK